MFKSRVYLCLCSVDLPSAGEPHAIDAILRVGHATLLSFCTWNKSDVLFFLVRGIRPIRYVGRSNEICYEISYDYKIFTSVQELIEIHDIVKLFIF